MKRDVTTNVNEMQMIIREYIEKINSSRLENLEEINFLMQLINLH
jgi:hypothetical protein